MFNLEDKEKKIGGKLEMYASGSGALSFVFVDKNREALGQRVTMRDAEYYLENRAQHLRGWKVGFFSDRSGPLAFNPLDRVSSDELRIDGRNYTYTENPLIVRNEEGRIVQHLSTLAEIRWFLAHEDEINDMENNNV